MFKEEGGSVLEVTMEGISSGGMCLFVFMIHVLNIFGGKH